VTGTHIDNRIDGFWAWIQHNAIPLRSTALAADRERDVDLLDAIVSGIYEQLAKISDELVVDLHVDSSQLTLAVRGVLINDPLVSRVLSRAPQIPLWSFASAIPQDFQSILACTPDGRTLSFEYSALRFELSFDQPTGKAHIILVSDDNFDPDGPDALVFHDVATHVLTTFLGPIPEAISTYRLVPARLAESRKTRPIFELAEAWRRASGS